MKIYFCDGCNESIPLADIQDGQVTAIKGKLFCRKCIPPTAAAASAEPARPGVGFGPVAALLAAVLLITAYLGWRDLPLLRGVTGGHVDEPAEQVELETSRQLLALQTDIVDLRQALEEQSRQAGFQHADVEELRTTAGAFGRSLDAVRADIDRVARGQAETGELIEKVTAVDNRQDRIETRVDTLADMLAGLQRGQRVEGLVTGDADKPTTDEPPVSVDPDLALVEELRQGLLAADADARFEAVHRIGSRRRTDLAPDLIPLIQDEDTFVRISAMEILGDFNAIDAVPHLFPALDDESALIRKTAAENLVRLTGFDPPYDPRASPFERSKAVQEWKEWVAARLPALAGSPPRAPAPGR